MEIPTNANPVSFYAARAATDRTAADTACGAALSEPVTVQRGAGRQGDVAKLSRRGPARLRALPGGRAVCRRRARAARLSAAGAQFRIDRSSRSRHLRLPAPWWMGIDRAVARSGPARPPACV